MTYEDMAAPDGQSNRIVYVRAMRPEEIPSELPQSAPRDALYSIHDETGQRVGIAPGRDVAFIAARQHELTPVSVH